MNETAVSLCSHFNNVGLTTDDQRGRGDFDAHGRSYAFEELSFLVGRPGGLDRSCDGGGRPDNVACEGQRILLQRPVEVAGCAVVGAAEGGSFEEPLVLFDLGRGRRQVRIGLSDWLAAEPHFAETCLGSAGHIHLPAGDLEGPCSHLWSCHVRVEPSVVSTELELPLNPSLHIFGITLFGPGSGS